MMLNAQSKLLVKSLTNWINEIVILAFYLSIFILDKKRPMGVKTDDGNPGKIKNSVSLIKQPLFFFMP
jgi:hypothetical protein